MRISDTSKFPELCESLPTTWAYFYNQHLGQLVGMRGVDFGRCLPYLRRDLSPDPMKTYTVTHPFGETELPCPEQLPLPQTRYKVEKNFYDQGRVGIP